MMTYETVKRMYDIPVRHNIEPASRHILLICHGFGSSMDSSTATRMSAMAEKEGLAFIAFDFPAHGKSPAADSQLTVPNCLEDLTAVYDYAKKLAPSAEISLFGSSMGAAIQLLWVSQQNKKGTRPVKNVVCRSGAVCTYSSLLRVAGGEEAGEVWRKQGVHEFAFERSIKVSYGFLRDFERYDVFQTFRKGKESYLFLHGTEDDIVPLDDVRRFTHLYKLNLVEVPGVGHRFDGPGELDRMAFEAISYIR